MALATEREDAAEALDTEAMLEATDCCDRTEDREARTTEVALERLATEITDATEASDEREMRDRTLASEARDTDARLTDAATDATDCEERTEALLLASVWMTWKRSAMKIP